MQQAEPKIPPINPDADVSLVKRVLAQRGHPGVEVHHDPEDDDGPEALRFNVGGAEAILRPTEDGRWSWEVDPHPGRQPGTFDHPIGGGGGTEDSIGEALEMALAYSRNPRP